MSAHICTTLCTLPGCTHARGSSDSGPAAAVVVPAAPAAAMTTATATTTATAAAATATAHLTTTHHNITTQSTQRRCAQHDQHSLHRSSAGQLDQPAQLARPARLARLAQLALLAQTWCSLACKFSGLSINQPRSMCSAYMLACFCLVHVLTLLGGRAPTPQGYINRDQVSWPRAFNCNYRN